MIRALIAILAGMLLAADLFNQGGRASRFVDNLRPFDAMLGITAIVLGILNLFSFLGLMLILGGLVLGARALSTVPTVGDDLVRAGDKIAGFRVLIGTVLIVLGVLRFLGWIF
ncbi:MAG TPA: hypothetical protein VFS56_08220 [Gemmatimonadaceae bacterium]|nr:hypothetical protein [Gemmatimonadaceae bacterium]